MRREWIEIQQSLRSILERRRLPPCGGSGLKYVWKLILQVFRIRLPPCGGSGLKYHFKRLVSAKENQSPSMRREWIEMQKDPQFENNYAVSLHAEGVD